MFSKEQSSPKSNQKPTTMGLDIFFYKRNRVADKEFYNTEESRDSYVELAYFRKVNFLVSFFNEFYDYENCEDLVISNDDLELLLERCRKVLSAKDTKTSMETLPTTEGFFFGSNDYDEYYYHDVECVINAIENDIRPNYDEGKEELIFHIWY